MDRANIPLVVSFLALAVSLLTGYYSYRAASASLNWQKEQAKKAGVSGKKADLRFHVGRVLMADTFGSSKGTRVEIENLGKAEARELTLTINGVPASGSPLVTPGPSDISKPLPPASTRTFYHLVPNAHQQSPRLRLRVTWQDDSAEAGEVKVDVATPAVQ